MKTGLIKVSLTSEQDRYQTVFRALDQIFEEASGLIYRLDPQKDYILLKPNCISANALASTHVDALKAVLDFLQPIWQGRVILAEGSGLGNTLTAFKNLHYLDLKPMFPKLEFLDLNYSESIFVTGFAPDLQPQQLRLSATVAQAPLRISVSPPKTHESVIVTLSIKNMAIGALLKEDKPKIHQGPRAINRTIAGLYKSTFPHLAILDGWVSMEGRGPVSGKPKETHFALASTDALAADTLTTEIMGFNPNEIGYLNLLGAKEIDPQICVVGENSDDFKTKFKPPEDYLNQLKWQ